MLQTNGLVTVCGREYRLKTKEMKDFVKQYTQEDKYDLHLEENTDTTRLLLQSSKPKSRNNMWRGKNSLSSIFISQYLHPKHFMT
ncbi:hypothetical protein EB796_025285 [Bugula neritina]|uniref:Uncharacterized protein n=1 Tax=Bugula neritina TaxID=10212 RepID=A0A7J7ISN8_BUGNE|nr:hypothetical protein EB796_025285 [Bugula neritina]